MFLEAKEFQMIPTYTFFAVDKGHMTLIQFSNGINMMVDCRSSPSRPSPLQYLQTKIGTLDFVVITHPHQDHLTGLKDICEHYRPRYLWHNARYFEPDPVYEDWSYYERLRTGQLSYCSPVHVRNGQTATIGDSKIRLASPLIPNLEGTSEDENNNGIILSIVTGNTKVVLTGDTEARPMVCHRSQDVVQTIGVSRKPSWSRERFFSRSNGGN